MIDIALEEDLGRGDVTTRLCVPTDARATGRVLARTSLTASGMDVFAEVMRRVDEETSVTWHCREGDRVEAGSRMGEVAGRTASLLMGERVALNFLQRLCGTATMARRFADALPSGCAVRLTDTRKTTPGLRYLERRAVLAGGGTNHRVDLGGGVLIKENHIAAAGSISAAVGRRREQAPHPLRIEVEVTCDRELDEALAAGADIILLDNMTTDEIQRAVKKANGRALLEASGGVNLQTAADIARTGVSIISVGAFTHSAPAADISFLIAAQ